jgi:hypothetical protein
MNMKRPLAIGSLASAAIIIGFSACGKPPSLCDVGYYLDTPQLCASNASLGFGLEFRTGTIIGTSQPNTLDLRNGGLADLVVESVTRTGDSAFTSSLSYDLPDGGSTSTLPTALQAGKHLYVQVLFAPTQARAYSGLITVRSNSGPEAIRNLLDAAAANGFTAVLAANQGQPDGGFAFLLSGCGVPADGGASPCYRDGGI